MNSLCRQHEVPRLRRMRERSTRIVSGQCSGGHWEAVMRAALLFNHKGSMIGNHESNSERGTGSPAPAAPLSRASRKEPATLTEITLVPSSVVLAKAPSAWPQRERASRPRAQKKKKQPQNDRDVLWGGNEIECVSVVTRRCGTAVRVRVCARTPRYELLTS